MLCFFYEKFPIDVCVCCILDHLHFLFKPFVYLTIKLIIQLIKHIFYFFKNMFLFFHPIFLIKLLVKLIYKRTTKLEVKNIVIFKKIKQLQINFFDYKIKDVIFKKLTLSNRNI